MTFCASSTSRRTTAFSAFRTCSSTSSDIRGKSTYGFTYALQVVVDSRDRQYKAQVCRHELVQCQQLHDAVVDFELQLVDGVFLIQHSLRQLLVRVQHTVDRLMHGTLGQAAHPEQPLFQLVQVLFEMAFHESLPVCILSALPSPKNKNRDPPHPNRPVM
jgi:hypothetical protein